MKRFLIPALIVLALAGIAFAVMTRGATREWTTDSKEALAKFEEGLELMMKFYYRSASEDFESALELDPDFAAPKVLLLYTAWERQDREKLLDELRATDLRSLTERERFLVGHVLAKADDDPGRADQLLEAYLASEPDDPYALMTCSTEAWEKRNWDKAARHYRRLIESDPNWVSAQNRLGYIAMAQGQFAEAEEAFLKYQYIAPDQANPHDSMGELLTLLGRYVEARISFEKALEIAPDFCAAYFHLVDLFVMSSNFEPIGSTLDAAGRHCNPEFGRSLECWSGFWQNFIDGDYEAAFAENKSECRQIVSEKSPFILHRLAISSDRFAFAEELEDGLRSMIRKLESDPLKPSLDIAQGLLLHMEGVRLAARGDLDAAQGKLLLADDKLLYWGEGQGILKLYNLLNLSTLLRQTGDERAADAIYEKVAAVNPSFAELVTSDDSLERQLRAR